MKQVVSNIDLLKAREYLWDIQWKNWLQEDIHEWTWWLNLALVILPIIVWWKLVDRKRISEIIIFGLHISIISVFLDVAGSSMVLWYYPDKLIPMLPVLVPFDLIIIPIAFMLLFQYKKSWVSFFIGAMVISAIFTFVAEPILIFLKIYQPIKWQSYLSFIIYTFIACISKLFTGFYISRGKIDLKGE